MMVTVRVGFQSVGWVGGWLCLWWGCPYLLVLGPGASTFVTRLPPHTSWRREERTVSRLCRPSAAPWTRSSGCRMGLTDQTALHQADDAACTVHPAVLFSIVDHYSRREEDQNRVIGTLLGTIGDDGEVTVCSCFPVPHTETAEQVAVNTDFHATMLQLHQRVYPKQQAQHTHT